VSKILSLEDRTLGGAISLSFSRDVGYHGLFSRNVVGKTKFEGWSSGIPHLAKDERDMGEPKVFLQRQNFGQASMLP
jgi:hypothetical protein